MKRMIQSILVVATLCLLPNAARASEPEKTFWSLAIHGGAGVAEQGSLTPSREKDIRDTLEEALEAGASILKNGGDSVAAVEAAVRILEDSPLFNAGRGAALNEMGLARHDAAIMRGSDRDVGAVAGSSIIRNPISAARTLMEQTETVMLDGEGADRFAVRNGLRIEDPLFFQTDHRKKQLLERRAKQADQSAAATEDSMRFGTVGAVAYDKKGNLAAATSTGGRTNKVLGRIGDSPIIGSGTYASNDSCAVSATGHGEYFIRWTVARDICALVEFKDLDIQKAAGQIINGKLKQAGGDGAVIALSNRGKPAFAMNGRGMYRGYIAADQAAGTAIYADQDME